MLTSAGSDPSNLDGKYISFRFEGEQSKSGKTQVWEVTAKRDGFNLGQVRWFARWRKYAFFPSSGCVFEEICLGDIIEFIKWATNTHKHGL